MKDERHMRDGRDSTGCDHAAKRGGLVFQSRAVGRNVLSNAIITPVCIGWLRISAPVATLG